MQAGRGRTTYGQQPLLGRNAAEFWPKSSLFIIINHYLCKMHYFNGRRKVILIVLLHISIVGRF